MTHERINRLKRAADEVNEEMTDASLARTIAAGHNPETSEKTEEIREAITRLSAAERERKSAWRNLEELLDSNPIASRPCNAELRALGEEIDRLENGDFRGDRASGAASCAG